MPATSIDGTPDGGRALFPGGGGKGVSVRRHPRLLLLVCFLISCGVAWWDLSPAFSSSWGWVDDHELAFMEGRAHRLPLSQVVTLALRSEAGHPGEPNDINSAGGSRYRPAYWVARILELATLGPNPALLHAFRVAEFVFCSTLFLWLVAWYTSVLEALALLVAVLLQFFWWELWVRLGPSETDAAVGCVLVALGIHLSRTTSTNDGGGRRAILGSFLCLVAGGVLSVGSKENFLVVLAPVIWNAWSVRHKPRALRASVWAATTLVGLFGAFVAGAVVTGVLHHGHVYGADTSTRGRLSLMGLWPGRLWELTGPRVLLVAGTLAAGHLAVWRLLQKKGAPGQLHDFLQLTGQRLLTIAALLLLHLSQFVFYGALSFYPGLWPWQTRYDFPGVLAFPLIGFIGWRMLLSLLSYLPDLRRFCRWLQLAGPALFAASGFFLAPNPLFLNAKLYNLRSRSYTAKLQEDSAILRAHPGAPVLFQLIAPDRMEILAGTARFLWFLGVDNPFYISPYDSAPSDALKIPPDVWPENERNVPGQHEPPNWRRWDSPPHTPCYILAVDGPLLDTHGCQDLGTLLTSDVFE
jgi:hypothetical protein